MNSPFPPFRADIWTQKFQHGPCPCGSLRPASRCCSQGNRVWRKEPATIYVPADGPCRCSGCYLAGFGECDPKLSDEHVISRSVLERIGRVPTIEGAAWQTPGKKNAIPIDRLVARVLCERHNSALSPLDSSAGRFMETVTSWLPKSSTAPVRFSVVSGADVERWALKALCGGAVAGWFQGYREARAPQDWCEILIGLRPWPPSWGLYTRSAVGSRFRFEPTTSLGPIFDDSNQTCCGLEFNIGGFEFALALSDAYAAHLAKSGWAYRSTASTINVNGRKKHCLVHSH